MDVYNCAKKLQSPGGNKCFSKCRFGIAGNTAHKSSGRNREIHKGPWARNEMTGKNERPLRFLLFFGLVEKQKTFFSSGKIFPGLNWCRHCKYRTGGHMRDMGSSQ